MSLVVWNFWTAVMVMWYRVFATQLAIIMFLYVTVSGGDRMHTQTHARTHPHLINAPPLIRPTRTHSTIPTFSYPFLDAVLMGNVFELYKRGPTSEEARRQQQGGPVSGGTAGGSGASRSMAETLRRRRASVDPSSGACRSALYFVRGHTCTVLDDCLQVRWAHCQCR